MEQNTDMTVPELTEAVEPKKANKKIDPLTGQVKRGFWQEEWHRLKKHRDIIWFVLPAMIIAFIFGYIPKLGVVIMFRDRFIMSGAGTLADAFATGKWSLVNFKALVHSADIGLAVKNTLVINAFSLLIVFPLPIIFALLLADIQKMAISKFVLIVLCLPHFLSWSMVMGIWGDILVEGGTLDLFLMNAGLAKEPLHLFDNNVTFKMLVIFLKIWKGTGWSSIIYYAAISSIDKSFFEAATLEGASKMQKIFYITLPTIAPTIGLQLVMTLTYIMNVGLEQLQAMYPYSGGAAELEQYVLDTYLYEISLGHAANAPLATVLGVVSGLISLVLMLGGNAITKKFLKITLW